MNTTITIGGQTINAEGRYSIHRRECLEKALLICRQAGIEPVFRCGCGRPLIPFAYHDGFRFRRARRAHLHAEDCGFYRFGSLRRKRGKGMFGGLRKRAKAAPSRGLGASAGEDLPRSTESIATFARQLLSGAYRTAHVLAHRNGYRGFCMPAENDFVEAVRRTIRELDFDGYPIDRIMEANGLQFKIAVGYIPEGGFETGTETIPLFVTRLPLQPGDSIKNEVWMLTPKVFARGVPGRTSQSGEVRHYWGPFFSIGACRPDGEYTDFHAVPAFRRAGVYGCVDSKAEADLAEYFDELNEAYFRTADRMDFALIGDLLGLPPDIAKNLRHKPDFIRLKHGLALVRFVEVTSYEKGAIAEAHSQAVVERLEHYLQIGQGRIETELWQMAGPVPQLIVTIRNGEDLSNLKEILSRTSSTGINV